MALSCGAGADLEAWLLGFSEALDWVGGNYSYPCWEAVGEIQAYRYLPQQSQMFKDDLKVSCGFSVAEETEALSVPWAG